MSGTLIHYIKQRNDILKFSFDYFITSNVFNITCCIDMDSFSNTSKAVILVTIYVVLCLQNKTFVDRVQNILDPTFVVSVIYVIYFSGTVLLSTVSKSAKFILSLFFSIFKYRIFMFFLF